MSLVNYVVIELTLNILFFHKMKLQKIKQLLFMAQKLEKPHIPYRRIILVTSHYCLWYILTFHTVFYQFINSRCSFAQSAPPPDCRLPRQSRTSCSWAVTSLGHGSGAGRGAGSADGDLRQTELDPWQLHLPPLVASVYQLLCLCLLDQH